MMKNWKKWEAQCLSNKVFDIVNWIILILTFLICLYPLYYVVIVSFSEKISGTYVVPNGFSLDAYKLILREKEVWIGYANTIINTVLNVVASLLVTLPGAYALSRKDLLGRNIVTKMMLVTMFISGGLIPSYLNVYNLGLVNTRAVIILLSLATTYNVIVARTFFATTIPDELLEAAKLDGCGNGKFFTHIVMPLSKPVTAVLALYVGVNRWNSYFPEMIYLRDKELSPLSLVLRRLLWNVQSMQQMLEQGLIEDVSGALAQIDIATVMQYCLIVVSALPMMIIYPFIQKYFAKGVMMGSVKG